MVSYDRRPGLVSRLMARRAAACAVAFDGSHAAASGDHRCTGSPGGAQRRSRPRSRGGAFAARPATRPIRVAVVGGSLGARRLNEVVSQVVERLADRRDLAIYHVVGERNLPDAAPARDGSHGIMYRVLGYEDRMPLVYAAADLMMTRAGAATIAELATVGMPAIIVPWPGAAENHQVDNARELSDHHGAVLIEERDLTADRLIAETRRADHQPGRAGGDVGPRRPRIGERHRGTALVDLIERVASA